MTLFDKKQLSMQIMMISCTLVSIYCSVQFYWSMGSNGMEASAFVAVGLIVTFGVLLLPHYTQSAWVDKRPFLVLVLFCLTIVALIMQIVAQYGFYAKSQADLEQQKSVGSLGYNAAKARLDTANERLNDMSKNANVDIAGLTAKLDALNAPLLAAKTALVKCPKYHTRNCIEPNQAKVDAIQSQITKIESQLGGGQGYQGALKERQLALDAMQTAANSHGANTEVMHPTWLFLSRLTGSPAKDLQAKMTMVYPVFTEIMVIMSSILLTVGLSNKDTPPENNMRNITPKNEDKTVPDYSKIAAPNPALNGVKVSFHGQDLPVDYGAKKT